jgi:hypothetical protein
VDYQDSNNAIKKRNGKLDAGSMSSDPQSTDVLHRIYVNINRYFRFNENNINRFRNDRYFLFYDQWSQPERQGFKDLNKPIFTYNKLYDFYRKLVGEQRFNTSSIEVRSLNDKTNQDAITLRADILRGIEYKSRAQIAYQTAFANAVSGGMGAIRLRTDYISPTEFKQDIIIEAVKFPERIFWDPLAMDATKTDGNFMGIYDQMDRDDFENKYPDVPYPISFPVNYNTRYFNWGDKKSITICEYYEKKWYNFTLYQLDDGTTMSRKDYKKMQREHEEGTLQPPPENTLSDQEAANQGLHTPQMMGTEAPPPVSPAEPQPMAGVPRLPQIVSRRKSRNYKIMCYKAVFGHILEEFEWPSKEFPFAISLGDEIPIDGELVMISLTRYAKDPQRFLNFLASDIAQAAKNNRREQFLVTPENIAGFEKFWKNPANQAGALPYNPDKITQQAPIRLPTPELPASLTNNLIQASADLKSIMGADENVYDKMLINNMSGSAMKERAKIGNSSNLIFFDNLKRAQEQIGKAILSMLPKIYDTQRTVVGHDVSGKPKDIEINKKIAGGVINDITKGDFDVMVVPGPNFVAQKEAAMSILMQIVGVNPAVFPVIADIIGKNIEIEDSVELVNRLKTMVPPDILAQSEGKPMPPQPPNPQQQMQQQMMQQQQQMMQAKLMLDGKKIDVQQQEIQMKAELNALQHQRDLLQIEVDRLKPMAEVEKANLQYKGDVATTMAKVATAHQQISSQHFEAIKNITGLMTPEDNSQSNNQNNQENNPTSSS